MIDRHEFFILIDQDGTQVGVTCLYSKSDIMRPCWPCHEDGDGEFTVPDDPPQPTCTYEEQVDNLDNIVHGSRCIPLSPVRIEWTGGCLELHLDEL